MVTKARGPLTAPWGPPSRFPCASPRMASIHIEQVHNDPVTPTPPQHCPTPARARRPRAARARRARPARAVRGRRRPGHAAPAGRRRRRRPRRPALSSWSTPRACRSPRSASRRPTTAGALTGVAGIVSSLQHNEFGAFRRLYLSPGPGDASRSTPRRSPSRSPARSPTRTSTASRSTPRTGHVLLLALTGHGTPSYDGRPLSRDRADPRDARGRARCSTTRPWSRSRSPRAGPGRAEDDHALGRARRRRLRAGRGPRRHRRGRAAGRGRGGRRLRAPRAGPSRGWCSSSPASPAAASPRWPARCTT